MKKNVFNFQGLIARRGPLQEVNKDGRTVIGSTSSVKKPFESGSGEAGPKDCYLSDLQKMLSSVVSSHPAARCRICYNSVSA
jgi:hypothetical protein